MGRTDLDEDNKHEIEKMRIFWNVLCGFTNALNFELD